jgi:hypothetical protein
MTEPVSDRDREYLSELLDGRLSPLEKQGLEERIAASTGLAGEWKQLQRLRYLMKSMPRHKPRRSFTLKEGTETQRKPSRLLFPLRLATGLASAVLVVLLALDAFPLEGGLTMRAAVPMAPAAVSESMNAERASTSGAGNDIILWSTPTVEAFGKGGGPPSMESVIINPSVQAAEPAPAAPEAPAQAAPAAPPLPDETSVDSLQGESPILGIPPTEQQEKVIETITAAAPVSPSEGGFPLRRIFEVTLAALAISCALMVVILSKRK